MQHEKGYKNHYKKISRILVFNTFFPKNLYGTLVLEIFEKKMMFLSDGLESFF